ncbi:MAG: DUF3298 and DUF4163 domain-containing protein [Chitinophagales bacterium]|nr:DUF3298 and DUF4163 domain-containing protein [Chitinophagales bacterium]
MRKMLSCSALLCCGLWMFFACGTKQQAPEQKSSLKVESSLYTKTSCVDEAKASCATFKVSYPIFSSGDTALTKALNQSLQEFVISAVGGNGQLPFAVALDSASKQFFDLFQADIKERPEMALEYTTQIQDTIPFLNQKVATVQMDGYSYTGGAHGNPFTMLVSYDLSKSAKPLEITDLISDTTAVKPILEKAYKVSKGLKETDPLTDVVYPEITQIPLPAQIAVVSNGVVFFYNAYEIAPYAVGASAVLLTWEQLGALADKQKWL